MNFDIYEFENYLVEQGIAPTTAKTYLSGARSFLKHCHGKVDPLHVMRVELYLTHLFLRGKSSAAIKSTLYQIRSFSRFLAIKGLKIDPSIDRLEPIQAWQSSQDVPAPHQIAKILTQPSAETFEGLRDRCLMALLYDCGLRLTEALELDLDHIDLKRRALTIRRRKTGRVHQVPLLSSTLHALKEFLPRRIFAGNWLFQDSRGQHLSTQNVYPHLMQHILKAPVPKKQVTPHLFRQACATHLLYNGADLPAVQTLLGHERTADQAPEIELRYLRKTLQNYHPRSQRQPKSSLASSQRYSTPRRSKRAATRSR